MRIIAGKWRSRRIEQPPTERTRSMPDRVKEAVFSMLGAHFESPGALPLISVADVFAGSASMGLEALSRGAASCRFFERDRTAAKTLKRNLAQFDVGSEADIIIGDAWRLAVPSHPDEHSDLVFLDPPYRDSEDPSPQGQVHRFILRLRSASEKSQIVVLHHHVKVLYESQTFSNSNWKLWEPRRYGTSAITVFER